MVYLSWLSTQNKKKKKVVLKVSGLWNVSKGKGMGKKKLMKSQLTYHKDAFSLYVFLLLLAEKGSNLL